MTDYTDTQQPDGQRDAECRRLLWSESNNERLRLIEERDVLRADLASEQHHHGLTQQAYEAERKNAADARAEVARLRAQLKKEAAVVQRWMALDLWMALGGESVAFETDVERKGWADTWAWLLHQIRDLRGSVPATPPEPTYYLAADVENRFREYVKGVVSGGLDERIGLAWRMFERVLTAFPASSETEEAALSSPASSQPEPTDDFATRLQRQSNAAAEAKYGVAPPAFGVGAVVNIRTDPDGPTGVITAPGNQNLSIDGGPVWVVKWDGEGNGEGDEPETDLFLVRSAREDETEQEPGND